MIIYSYFLLPVPPLFLDDHGLDKLHTPANTNQDRMSCHPPMIDSIPKTVSQNDILKRSLWNGEIDKIS